jgi:hypothetical protein
MPIETLEKFECPTSPVQSSKVVESSLNGSQLLILRTDFRLKIKMIL